MIPRTLEFYGKLKNDMKIKFRIKDSNKFGVRPDVTRNSIPKCVRS